MQGSALRVGFVLLIVGGVAWATQELQPITQLNPGPGLAGGGTGPTTSISVAPGGIASEHLANGAVKLGNLDPTVEQKFREIAASESPVPMPQLVSRSLQKTVSMTFSRSDVSTFWPRSVEQLHVDYKVDGPRTVRAVARLRVVNTTLVHNMSLGLRMDNEIVDTVSIPAGDPSVLTIAGRVGFSLERTMSVGAGSHTVDIVAWTNSGDEQEFLNLAGPDQPLAFSEEGLLQDEAQQASRANTFLDVIIF